MNRDVSVSFNCRNIYMKNTNVIVSEPWSCGPTFYSNFA